jgi:hypothetical protein
MLQNQIKTLSYGEKYHIEINLMLKIFFANSA